MSIKVKDADGIDKYYQTIEVGDTSNPFQSVIPSYDIAHATKEIFETYGDVVSVWNKSKTLIKFGKNPDIDSGITETVWNTGGNETLKTANDIDVVVSTDASDTQTIVIEGHTISGNDLTFVTQTATLNGTTPVSLTTPLARATRLINTGSSNFAGDITVEDSGTSVHLTVLGTVGENQSKKCATAISQSDYFIISQLSGGCVGSTSARAVFQFQIKPTTGVWRTIREFAAEIYTEIPLSPPLIIPPNHDTRIIATSFAANTVVVAEYAGYLAEIV